MPKPKAIVLLSGGIDSTTVLAIVKQRDFDVYALSFDYGQRHWVELQAASKVAQALGATNHMVVHLDLALFGGSALTALTIDVPKDGLSSGIPVTYVPARNTIFLSLALAWAEKLGAHDIFIGANVQDNAGYPDCRPEYLRAYEQMAQLASLSPIKIHAPLLEMSKADIIRRGLELGIDYEMTHSCYDPASSGAPCTRCDACRLRAQGFADVLS
jgi:7-cyano-7-deazaguanine synthase